MKKTILILVLVLLAVIPAGAIKRIDANPVNIAYILSQESDSTAIASTLAYYGYVMEVGHPDRQTKAPGDLKAEDSRQKTVYTHPNGSTIRITPPSGGWRATAYPTVEVKSHLSSNAVLTSLQFKKTDSSYIKNVGQYARTETRCTYAPGGYLLFQRIRL